MQQAVHKRREGSITIYLAMTLAVLLSLVLALVESARERALWLLADCGVDLAVYSVFAEYNRELFDAYDLLFVDTSYLTGETGNRLLEKHLERYIDENLSDGNTAPLITKDLTGAFLQELTIDEFSLATDGKGEIFERQAVAYMKQKYGVGYIEDLKNEFERAKENELFTKDVASEREGNEGALAEAKKNGIDTGEVDEDGNPIMEDVEFENPADGVNAGRSMGILNLVAPAAEVSQKGVKTETLLSKRGIQRKGDGLCGREDAGAMKKMWFALYTCDHTGNYLHPKEDGVLAYQMEYILSGKSNDTDNLKSVTERLLLLRETANVVFLFSDAAKVSEAEALALSIASAAGAPVLTELIKISLLFAWAFAESVWDVRQLLAGRRIPLMKTAADWHFSLEGMLNYQNEGAGETVPGQDENGGQQSAFADGMRGRLMALSEGKLGYEEYLMLFLFLEKEETVVLRMMDIAEMDVRSKSGDYGFRLEDCMDHMSITAVVEGKLGGQRTVKRKFSYT